MNKLNNLIHSKLGKDVIFTFAAQMMIMVSFLIVNKILSNSLGIEGYGQFSLIKKNSAVLSMVMLGGMGIALPRFFAFYRGKGELNKSNLVALVSLIFVLIISIIVSLLGLFLYKPFEFTLIGDHNLKLYFITYLYSFSIGISAYMYAFYRGTDEFKKYNITQIIVQVLILISCLFYYNSLSHILLLWSILTILYTFYELFNSFRRIFRQLDLKGLKREFILIFKEIAPFGFTRLLGDLVLFSFYAIPLIFSNSMFGITDTAYFSVGMNISNIITPLFALLGMILLPYVSEHAANENHAHIQQAVNKLMILYFIISVILTLILSVWLPFFIELLFNKEYMASVTVSRIIIWSIIAQSFYLLLRNPLDAVSMFPINTLNLSISFVVMLILFYNSKSINDLGNSFLISNCVLAILSIVAWYVVYPKFIIKQK